MPDCPIHGHTPDEPVRGGDGASYDAPTPGGSPGDIPDVIFARMIEYFVTAYIGTREMTTGLPDAPMVTIDAYTGPDHDMFTLRIGLGGDASAAMTAERDAREAECDAAGKPARDAVGPFGGWESGACADPVPDPDDEPVPFYLTDAIDPTDPMPGRAE